MFVFIVMYLHSILYSLFLRLFSFDCVNDVHLFVIEVLREEPNEKWSLLLFRRKRKWLTFSIRCSIRCASFCCSRSRWCFLSWTSAFRSIFSFVLSTTIAVRERDITPEMFLKSFSVFSSLSPSMRSLLLVDWTIFVVTNEEIFKWRKTDHHNRDYQFEHQRTYWVQKRSRFLISIFKT